MKEEKERKMKIKYIDPWDLGYIIGTIFFIMSIVIGIIFEIILGSFLSFSILGEELQLDIVGKMMVIFITALLQFLIMYLFGLIFAGVYNSVAAKRGGVEIRVSE